MAGYDELVNVGYGRGQALRTAAAQGPSGLSAPAAMTQAAITGGEPPTEAEFNALRADVAALRTTVAALVTAVNAL